MGPLISGIMATIKINTTSTIFAFVRLIRTNHSCQDGSNNKQEGAIENKVHYFMCCC